MRLLDIDVDLILMGLTVLLTVWAAAPPAQPPVEVPIVCIEMACCPMPLVLP